MNKLNQFMLRHKIEHYSAMQRNQLFTHTPSEMSQTKRMYSVGFCVYKGLNKWKLVYSKRKNCQCLFRDREEGRREELWWGSEWTSGNDRCPHLDCCDCFMGTSIVFQLFFYHCWNKIQWCPVLKRGKIS